jgi:predicted secreted protein
MPQRRLAGLITLAAAWFSPLAAFAGDYAELHFIGFSKDRTHLAFEEYGSEDGSGFPYSNIYFVETEGNRSAGAPVRVKIEKDAADLSEARAEAKAKAEATLKKLAIVEGETGDLVVDRLLTDISGHANTEKGPLTLAFARRIFSSPVVGRYELTLTPSSGDQARCDGYDMPRQIFRLDLADTIAKISAILQQDAALPESRQCAFAYGVHRVYWSGDRIAVFLSMLKPGFEGPDLRYLVVTGKQADPDMR